MDANLGLWVVDHLLVACKATIGRTNGDMVGVDTEGLQALLDIDANGAAAAPQSNDGGRAKTRIGDADAKPEGILEQFSLGDEAFCRWLAQQILPGNVRSTQRACQCSEFMPLGRMITP